MTDPELVRGSVFYQRLPLISEQPWDELNASGWNYLKRHGDVPARIVSDLTAPHSPSNVLEIDFFGCTPNNDPGVHWHSLPNSSKVYWEYWIKLSFNFLASPAGFCKTNFVFSSSQGQLYHMLCGIDGEWMSLLKPDASVMQLASCNEFSTASIPAPGHPEWPNTGIYEFSKREEWIHCAGYIDVEKKVWRSWQNDVLTGNYENVEPLPDPESLIEFQFAMTVQDPHWDGSAVKEHMYARIDHTIIRGDVNPKRRK